MQTQLDQSYRQVLGTGKIQWKKALLLCGVASAPLYFGLDAVAALLYDGYNYLDQAPSELSAFDVPTRWLWLPLGFLYALLVTAFAAGVWSVGHTRRLHVVAFCLLVVGILGLVVWPFAPMHQREVLAAGGGTFADTMHLILGAADTLLFFLMVGFGATAGGKRFRAYSVVTIVLMLIFGAYTGMQAPKVQANEDTPWLGIAERIAVFGPMLWIAVLSLVLYRRESALNEVEGR